ncbi:fused MFS/spermidine synthase [Yinghuangia sp. ASG 101]|uniref:spermidine synthase n=1 Tax=Yinghuangia sp. ASG 101 TaxID=2896848 RepID=UPI001E62D2BD|nr:fused MFS/spermidine synthase [Yinghuangia sp. ASG 101]UGQ12613.1 fused MFS/spermidine synthase [Yinghuangia sp. ASG 101]
MDSVPVSCEVDFGRAALLPDVDRARAWLLTLDGSPQSYVDLDDPEHVEFEYARRLAHVIDLAGRPGTAPDVLHLGGGGLTLPRYTAATRPGSRQHVVDVDAALIAFVRTYLPLPPNAAITVEAADARAAVAERPDASADIVVADVFGGARIPAHLTALPFVADVARVLRGDGVYAANLADGGTLDFLRGQVATVSRVFDHVCLLIEATHLDGTRFGNAVLAASRVPLPVDALAARIAADPYPAVAVHGAELSAFAAGHEPVTDASATGSPAPPGGVFGIG